MLKETILTTPSADGVTLSNLYVHHTTKPDTVAVILPGARYTCDRPVLYYAREVALESGLDTFSIQYAFTAAGKPFSDRLMPVILKDALTALEACLAQGYRKVVFIGKTLGCQVAIALADQIGQPSRQFFLTPAPRSLDAILSTPCTVIAGAADRAFTPSTMIALKNAPGIDLHIIAGAGHALEVHGDYHKSLAALGDICGILRSFLRG